MISDPPGKVFFSGVFFCASGVVMMKATEQYPKGDVLIILGVLSLVSYGIGFLLMLCGHYFD